MPDSVVVRPARPEDIDDMIQLIAIIFSAEEDFSVDPAKQRRGLELFFAYPDLRCLLVAEQQQTIIGMCSAQLLVSTAEGGWKALVEDVVVAASARGKGIGKRMLARVAQWAADQGATRLDLLADRDNLGGLQFYHALQWKQTNLIALQKHQSNW